MRALPPVPFSVLRAREVEPVAVPLCQEAVPGSIWMGPLGIQIDHMYVEHGGGLQVEKILLITAVIHAIT